MPSIYPVVFGYNYAGEQVKDGDGKTVRLSAESARSQNIFKLLSYIPIINNIMNLSVK